jgi:hypothetical protein
MKTGWPKYAAAAVLAGVLASCAPERSVPDEYGWVDGSWYRSCDTGDVMITFFVSADGIGGLMGLEAAPQSDPPRRGNVHIEGVWNGYTRFRPQTWLNSELRMKQVSADEAEAVVARRDATVMVWETDEPYRLYKCPSPPREA